jgi:hypothetical protein
MAETFFHHRAEIHPQVNAQIECQTEADTLNSGDEPVLHFDPSFEKELFPNGAEET